MITLNEAIEILSRPKTMKGTPQDILEAHDMAITALRQPEIIRCRECRHWYTGDGYNHENGAQCALTHMWMSPDDYCSYGRRKVSE